MIEDHQHAPTARRDRSINAIKPDVIGLDLRLPCIKDNGAAGQCRRGAGSRDMPTIAGTAFSSDYCRTEVLAAGCEAHFIKPINTGTLLQQVDDVVAAEAQEVAA